MNPQLREFRAQQLFERLIGFCRHELATTERTDHLGPVVESLDFLLPECSRTATWQTDRYGRELAELKGHLHAKVLRKLDEKKSRGPVKAKPKLRLVK
jgi:hypothetical protein